MRMTGRFQQGFSLAKGMLVIMVGAFMALGIGPMFFHLLNNQRVMSYTNNLVVDLRYARSQAVDRRVPVSLCRSSNGYTCTDGEWTQGYIVFIDTDVPGQVDAQDEILRRVTAQTPHVSARLVGAGHVRFLNNGGLISQVVPQPVGEESNPQPTWLSVLAGLLPISAAHAESFDSVSIPTTVTAYPRFLVCAGTVGRKIKINAVGHVSTDDIGCRRR